MLFEIINNTIENLLLSSFIAQYLKLDNKKYHFIFITVFINTIISTILTALYIIDFRQTLIIQLVLWLGLYIYNKNFSFQNIAISLFGNILLAIAVYFSNLFFNFLSELTYFKPYFINGTYIWDVVLGKIIFLILIILTLKFRPILLNDTKIENLNYLLVGEILLLVVMIYYFLSYVLNQNFSFSSNVIFLCFLLLFFTFNYIFNQFIKMNQLLYEVKLKEQQEKYMKENLQNLKSVKYEIENIEHRMNYILQSVEYDLQNKNYNNAMEKIKKHKETIRDVAPVFCTGNETFNFMMNLEMKFLSQNGKKIKVCTFMSQNIAYDQLSFIHRIIDVLKYLYTFIDEIELFLIENESQVLEVKYILSIPLEEQKEIENGLLNYQDYDFSIVKDIDLLVIEYKEYLNDYNSFFIK